MISDQLVAAGIVAFLVIGTGCSKKVTQLDLQPQVQEADTAVPEEPEVDPEISPELLAKVSYNMGFAFGVFWAQQELEPDHEMVQRGIEDGLTGDDRPFSQAELEESHLTFQTKLGARRQLRAGRNATEGAEYLAMNSEREGVVTLPSGMQYEILETGDGPMPTLEDTVRVHYSASRIDGRRYESSRDKGQPSVFAVTAVIEGWKEGLQLMPVGSHWKLYIPSSLAYGSQGYKGYIQPNDTLIYDVELLAIEPPAETIEPESG